MQTDLVAIVCGLAAGIGWGVSGFFDAKASRSIGPLLASVLINGIVAVGYALVYLLFFRNGHHVQAAGVYYAIASGVVITLGALSYFRGLARGPVALVSPLSARSGAVLASGWTEVRRGAAHRGPVERAAKPDAGRTPPGRW